MQIIMNFFEVFQKGSGIYIMKKNISQSEDDRKQRSEDNS